MKIHPLLSVAILVSVNNLAWYALSGQNSKSQSQLPQQSISVNKNETCLNMLPTRPVSTEQRISSQASNKNLGSAAPTSSKEPQSPPTDLVLDDEVVDLEFHSNDLKIDQEIKIENFDFQSTEDQLDTISILVPQGSELELLSDIALNNETAELRLAAINQLTAESSYLATTTLINAIDDSSEEVSILALQTIAQSRDRSLIPLLEKKLASTPSGTIYDEIEQSIDKLAHSVTMHMDSSY